VQFLSNFWPIFVSFPQNFPQGVIIVPKMPEWSPINFSSTRTSDSDKTGSRFILTWLTVTNCYPECTRTHNFDIKIQNFFSGEGAVGSLPPQTPHPTLSATSAPRSSQTEILATPLRRCQRNEQLLRLVATSSFASGISLISQRRHPHRVILRVLVWFTWLTFLEVCWPDFFLETAFSGVLWPLYDLARVWLAQKSLTTRMARSTQSRRRPAWPSSSSFLPRDAMRCAVFAICPSVRMPVTLVHCVHMFRPTITISSPYGSPIILVFRDIRFIPKFERGHPERGRWIRVWWVQIGDFRLLSRRISQTVPDTTKLLLITNRKSNTRFRLVPKSRTLVDPEMTLDRNYALCCITLVFFGANC